MSPAALADLVRRLDACNVNRVRLALLRIALRVGGDQEQGGGAHGAVFVLGGFNYAQDPQHGSRGMSGCHRRSRPRRGAVRFRP